MKKDGGTPAFSLPLLNFGLKTMTHNQYDEEIKAEVFNAIDKIGMKQIDSLAVDFGHSYEWLKCVEIDKARFGIEPFYLAIYHEGKLMALAQSSIQNAFQYFTPKGKNFLIRVAIDLSHRLGLSINRGRAIDCSLTSISHEETLPGDNFHIATALDLIFDKIDYLCKRKKILLSSFSLVPESEKVLIQSLQNSGYSKTDSRNSFYLDIQWSSLEEYVGSLEKKVRKNVRREMKRCRESGVTIEEESLTVDYATILSNLYSNLNLKYHTEEENPFATSFFRNLAEYAGDKTRLFVARKIDRITGFSLSLKHRDILDVLFYGFEANTQSKTDFTYFNLIYYAPIDLAIKEGIRRINYHTTMDEVKLKRGCNLEQLHSFTKVHNGPLRLLINLYLNKNQRERTR
jgi:hypothetical protein